jgi:uncharacterized protein YdeI (YjbR/CyaY-like superfamily)
MEKIFTVDEYISKNPQWEKELSALREILLKTNLTEKVKWNAPIYVDENDKNIVGVAGFKNYFGLWFHQGVFLKDPHNKLQNAQEEKTKALRQWRFTNLQALLENEHIILDYVNEAILNQQNGLELKPQKNKPIDIPELLQEALLSDNTLKLKFEALSPGKRRDYADHIADAKREATKLSRLDKIKPMILSGVGLHDKYKNC